MWRSGLPLRIAGISESFIWLRYRTPTPACTLSTSPRKTCERVRVCVCVCVCEPTYTFVSGSPSEMDEHGTSAPRFDTSRSRSVYPLQPPPPPPLLSYIFRENKHVIFACRTTWKHGTVTCECSVHRGKNVANVRTRKCAGACLSCGWASVSTSLWSVLRKGSEGGATIV